MIKHFAHIDHVAPWLAAIRRDGWRYTGGIATPYHLCGYYMQIEKAGVLYRADGGTYEDCAVTLEAVLREAGVLS